MVGLDVLRTYLADVAKHMGTVRILVLAYGAPLYVEAWEAVHLLLKDTEVLVGELVHEYLLGEARVARILGTVLDIVHALVELVLGNAQSLAELHRVEPVLRLVHHHHDIVGGLVEHQQLSVTVAYNPTGRKGHFLQESVRVSTLLIVVAGNLK